MCTLSLFLSPCDNLITKKRYLASKSLAHGLIIAQHLPQEGEQDRNDDGCLCGLSEDDKEDGDREVVCGAHFCVYMCLLQVYNMVAFRMNVESYLK